MEMEVSTMQQRNESNYPEVISMEEYLTKRQKIREKEQKGRKKGAEKERSAWMLAQLYV
ncbi:hypothetical protein CLOHYLEM_04378 [[Clostridium] hylemonae DSM 15053]|uniref:Uncharacterized protein n=2 Tax=[Clostridium] hylemonae TaxID=89153 RepID=C0BX44_9FIRM|nr:hypothetical protein CLOHYLEM_04378 [[Clostridium] hylemonae DSM 15053]